MQSIRMALRSLADPTRQEYVAAVGELLLVEPSLVRMRQRMLQTKDGRAILRHKPLINTSTIDMQALAEMPLNTFGR